MNLKLRRLNRRQFIVGSASLLVAGCIKKVASPTPVIQTQSGPVQGEIVNGVHRFLGIPYAEPPFGKNRWKSPVRRQRWPSVFPANKYGPICPQTGGLKFSLPKEGEDSLNLNIWTPDPSARNLPVMVWAHGGGQISGSGSNELYDGTNFAMDGVVLITCNRRLGAEGYLYLEELFGDGIGPGNLGIQDLIFVLEWVQENVEYFGGNPGNVTLFGESGGAAATQALVATPGSKGLLRRVIPQSGGHAAQRTEKATAVTLSMLSALSIETGDIESLRKVPWPSFIEAFDKLDEEQLGNPQIYLPVINQHMPVHPVDASHLGIGLEIDYLIGTCRDEANLFSALMPTLENTLFHRRATKLIEKSGHNWNDLASAYRAAFPELDQGEIFNRLLGDMWFRIPSLRIAYGRAEQDAPNTYAYQFDWESPLMGAAHGMDLMVFGNGPPLSVLAGFADYQKTADFMRKSWIRFAAEGNPSTPGFTWPVYGTDKAIVSIKEIPSVRFGPAPELSLLQTIITENWQGNDL